MMKKKMKMIPPALLLALLCGCGSEEGPTPAGGSQGTETQEEKPVATFTSDLSATRRAAAGLTRTTISHTLGAGAQALWETGDRIWVKADDGTLHQSAAGVFNAALTQGMFSLSAGTFSSGCQVNYTGRNATAGDRVTIAAAQSQHIPNNFSHAGAAGDCGTATATGSGADFTFRLAHKAAYLCFLPRCVNAELGANIYLTKIVVTSTDGTALAGTYDFADGTLQGKTPQSGAASSVTLSLNDFPLTNTTTSVETNGAYLVIAPGTYSLSVDYHIKDPATQVQGVVNKRVSLQANEGTISEVTAWIDKDITQYGSKYYMWDAAVGQHYWKGYEAYQPKLNGGSHAAYPLSAADPRWCNSSLTLPNYANRSCATCPNANQILWYVLRGNPCWDEQTLWTTMGHLYNTGMWFLKSTHIPGFTHVSDPYGHNWHMGSAPLATHATPTEGKPANTDRYFYLPSAGRYLYGDAAGIGTHGLYWSSTAGEDVGSGDMQALSLYFYKGFVTMHYDHYIRGRKLWKLDTPPAD